MLGALGVSVVSTYRVFVSQLEADGMNGVVRLETSNLWSSFSLLLRDFSPVTRADSYHLLGFQFLVLVVGFVSDKVLRRSASLYGNSGSFSLYRYAR